jgi:hypothetical protein
MKFVLAVLLLAQATQGPAAAPEACQRHDQGASAARVLAGRVAKMHSLLAPALLRGGGSETSRVDCTGCGQSVRHCTPRLCCARLHLHLRSGHAHEGGVRCRLIVLCADASPS